MNENYVVMDKTIYAPEVMQYDYLFYDRNIDPEPHMFAVHPLDDGRMTADKIGVIQGGDVMLQNGDTIATGDICGIVTEIRRSQQPPVDMQEAAAKWVNAYHARHPETPYNGLWEAAEAAFMAALD